MPMYDYSCESCGHKFEELVMSHSTPDSEIVCPNCKKQKSKRMLCAPVVNTKGQSSTPSQTGCGVPSGFT